MKTILLKKGTTHLIDTIYDIMGLIPNKTYEQDDPADWSYDNMDNDSGESITMLKTVTIKYEVKVK